MSLQKIVRYRVSPPPLIAPLLINYFKPFSPEFLWPIPLLHYTGRIALFGAGNPSKRAREASELPEKIWIAARDAWIEHCVTSY